MKYFTEDNGIVTYRAVPFPLPMFVQQQLKESAVRLKDLRTTMELADSAYVRRRAADKYAAAQLDLDQQEELIRAFAGVSVTRPEFVSIAPEVNRGPAPKKKEIVTQ